ncbi:MAG: dTMP kinase [Fimbriimonadaceae bacterium]|nr:MAG: thymidylate kinase [Armatimonadetes bacterium OLB18]WKZ79532.1 MAG: dTMP kinase [Fimbriimonadaceae bacterium]
MFITFEGGDGAGKSTAVQSVATALASNGIRAIVTRQPGDGPLGPSIRQLLLHREMPTLCELFLFLADRNQHVERIVRPALERGDVVLCDRYGDSTVAYQGYARGLDVALLKELNGLATGGLCPDLTLLLDLQPEVGLGRLESKDRLDKEALDFHRRIREGFLALAAEDPGRWRVIDASLPASEVSAECVEAVMSRIECR